MPRNLVVVAVALAATACGRGVPDGLRPWLAEWEALRPCVIGRPPADLDRPTAAAISELSGSDPAECHAHILGLIRSGPRDSQDGDLVDAWRAAHSTATQGFYVHGSSSERGQTIARLEAQVATLRRQAGLDAPAQPVEAIEVTALPAGRPVMVGGSPLVAADTYASYRMFWAGTIRSATLRGDYLGDAFDALQPRLHPRNTDLAYPSGQWAAGLSRGTIGETLEIHEPPLADPPVLVRLPGEHHLLAATDAGDARAVFLQPTDGQDQAFTLVVSIDEGRTWRVIPVPGIGRLETFDQDPRSGLVDVITRTSGGLHLFRFPTVDPASTPTPVELPGWSRFACRHGGVLWGIDERQLYRTDDRGGEAVGRYQGGDVIDCRADAALVLEHHPDRLTRCRGTVCTEVFRARHRHDGVGALLDDGSWIYAAAIGDVVGVWREGAPTPRFYRLAGIVELAAIAVTRGAPHLVAVGPDHVFQSNPLPR